MPTGLPLQLEQWLLPFSGPPRPMPDASPDSRLNSLLKLPFLSLPSLRTSLLAEDHADGSRNRLEKIPGFRRNRNLLFIDALRHLAAFGLNELKRLLGGKAESTFFAFRCRFRLHEHSRPLEDVLEFFLLALALEPFLRLKIHRFGGRSQRSDLTDVQPIDLETDPALHKLAVALAHFASSFSALFKLLPDLCLRIRRHTFPFILPTAKILAVVDMAVEHACGNPLVHARQLIANNRL